MKKTKIYRHVYIQKFGLKFMSLTLLLAITIMFLNLHLIVMTLKYSSYYIAYN